MVKERIKVQPYGGFVTDQAHKIEAENGAQSYDVQIAGRRKMSGMGEIIGTGILVALATRGAISAPSDFINIANDLGVNLPNPLTRQLTKPMYDTVNPEKDSGEEENLKTQIENEYGIKLYNMQEAYGILGLEYNVSDETQIGQRPPVRWSIEQLDSLKVILPLLPTDMLVPTKDTKTGFFIGDFGTNCNCSGVYFGDGMIGFQADYLNSDKKGVLFSMFVHEGTHEVTDLENPGFIQKIKAITGDSQFTSLKEFNPSFNTDNLTDGQNLSVLAFKSLATGINSRTAVLDKSSTPHVNVTEGIAEISQIYILGYDNFLRLVGLILDGGGYIDRGAPKVDLLSPLELEEFFPKAKNLYDLYKFGIFEGKEYTGHEFENPQNQNSPTSSAW